MKPWMIFGLAILAICAAKVRAEDNGNTLTLEAPMSLRTKIDPTKPMQMTHITFDGYGGAITMPWDVADQPCPGAMLCTTSGDYLYGLTELAKGGQKVEVCVHVDGKAVRCEQLRIRGEPK